MRSALPARPRAQSTARTAWRGAAQLRRGWTELLGRLGTAGGRTTRDLVPLERNDLPWALASGVLSAILFATSLTGHAGLGDAPETVAGVSSLGILHAPGYPAYVLSAKLFTLLVPVGSEAFRVNLFSLLCAAASIAGVQLLARRCGAARWAAAAAALCLAASAGFVFYSGFAKHDMFSGLLLLLTIHLALAWWTRPVTRRFVALGIVFGLGLGSSWPLEVLAGPSVLFVVLAARRALPVRTLLRGGAAAALTVIVLYGFVMVRAGENPRLDWGHATTFSALSNLVRRTDFTGSGTQDSPPISGQPGAGTGGATGTTPPPAAILLASASTGADFAGYSATFIDELGVVGVLLACGGLLLTLWAPRPSTYPIIILFATNLVGAAALVGAGTSHSLDTALTEEGFLLGCYFALVTWTAIAAGELAAGFWRAVHRRLSRSAGWLWRLTSLAIATALIVPVVADSRTAAHVESHPFADRYASWMLAQLPPHAALFVWSAELSQPLILHQVVEHERPDVVVIAADGLSYPWYHAQIARELGQSLPPIIGNSTLDAQRTVDALVGRRPVLLDPQAVENLKGDVGYRPLGLLAQALPGTRETPIPSPAALGAKVLQAERAAGLPDQDSDRWPNAYLEESTYSTAALLAARTFYAAHNIVAMRQMLENVLQIDPSNSPAHQDLSLLDGNGTGG